MRFSPLPAAARRAGQRPLDLLAVTGGLHGLQAVDLLALQRGIDPVDRRLAVVALRELVDADDDAVAAVDAALQLVAGVRDLALREVLLDRLDHAAELVDAAEVVVGLRAPSRRSAPR